MSMCEIHDAYLAEGTVNGDIFDNIVDKCLLPCLMPFNGINPRSVVVMDNASIHHVDKIRDLIEQKAKAILCFLPPYSPGLMLAEGVFRVFLRLTISSKHHTMSATDDGFWTDNT